MIPKECKRLAEVDFPIAVVSKHAAREKSIRHGHPSTLHLWWARRPLAACRAMLLGLLLPDPCDENCPPDFKKTARELFLPVPGISKIGPTDEDLQKALLQFIGDFANWDLSSDRTYLETARGLVKGAHPEETPLVVDPFAGGGSIPLEALRLGCEAFASDLNPVACLIQKVMLEDIPRYGPELADDLRQVGTEIKQAAEKKLAELYPLDPGKARPIAYLWARTVRCESPNCGAEIPLLRSLWLCKKAGRGRALRLKPVICRGKIPEVEVEIFKPLREGDVRAGTVSRAKATCPCCNNVLPPERVRAQLSEQRGGGDVHFDSKGKRVGGAKLMAVVILQPGNQGRQYRLSASRDYKALWNAIRKMKVVGRQRLQTGINPIPDEPLNPVRPSPNARGLSAVTRYGIATFGDLFTRRQLLALMTVCSGISSCTNGPLRHLVAFALSKLADLSNSLCRWEPVAECPRQLFTRHAAAIAWDFAEGVPTSSSSGGFAVCLENVIAGLASLRAIDRIGNTGLADATDTGIPSDSVSVWFADPPYYDAIPYADLADFFFVWFKRSLGQEPLLRDRYDPANPLTPKLRECVWNQGYIVDGRPKDGAFFEKTAAKCFFEARRVLQPYGIGGVVFAHRTTEGWEAILNGIIQGGWTVTGSWPIATEMTTRIRARDTAALATSVHLVCRPRPDDAPTGDWGEVLRELPRRVGEWMERLQSEGVRGADLVFACIGPALEIFSRYSKVETAEGKEIKLDEFLLKVWEVVGRAALEQVLGTAEARARNGAAGVLEEDARLTALFLWTLQATTAAANGKSEASDADDEGVEADEEDEDETPAKKVKGFTLVYDVVRRFAQPLGIHLPDWENRIIEVKKGVVRLLPVGERAEQLFGEDGASAVADRIESSSRRQQHVQLSLFPDEPPAVKGRKGGRRKGNASVSDETLRTRREATTLDRVHAAMLLQASGRANALRALLESEQGRGTDFLRLANALSALYPTGSEEKRLLDAMLLAMPK